MCTNFKYPAAADGTVCVGRTMEFPNEIPWQLGVLASNYAGQSTVVPNGKSWQGKYGVVGFSAFDNPQWYADAMNTQGLSAHALYMPGHCTYYPPKGDGTDIGVLDVISFVLGTCTTTADAKAALATCNVVDKFPPQIPIALPLHIIVHDKTSCIVAEFHPDGMRVLDNPVQVATNSPYLEWHLTNVANYLSFTPDNPAPIQIGGETFAPFAQGQGFRGLPADGTSPSRFIRALTTVRFASTPSDQQAAELGTIRVLHGFDIVPGNVEETGAQGLVPELTMWSTVSDLTANRYLVNVFSDPQWYAIDLATLDFTSSRSKPLPSGGALAPLSL
jgi:choloylglycine hydrolase